MTMDDERPTPRARLILRGKEAWIEVQLDDTAVQRPMYLPAKFARDLADCILNAYADLTAARN